MRGIVKRSVQSNKKEIKKTSPGAIYITFSFRFFDKEDDEICPPKFHEDYTQALMARLKVLCEWTVEKFQKKSEKNIRNHIISWDETSRVSGFLRIPMEHRSVSCWQFAVKEREHGRVHGFFIGDTFYVVWLDCHHALYPAQETNS